MRKGCLVCGIILAFFGLVLLVLLPVANWVLYPMIERAVILKYLDLKPENAEIWDAWVCHFIKLQPCSDISLPDVFWYIIHQYSYPKYHCIPG